MLILQQFFPFTSHDFLCYQDLFQISNYISWLWIDSVLHIHYLGWLWRAQEYMQQVWSFWIPHNSMVPQRFFGAEEVRPHNFLFHTLLFFLTVILTLNLHLCRYEGQRSVEALAEFVNSEAGGPRQLPRIVFNHAFLFKYQISGIWKI